MSQSLTRQKEHGRFAKPVVIMHTCTHVCSEFRYDPRSPKLVTCTDFSVCIYRNSYVCTTYFFGMSTWTCTIHKFSRVSIWTGTANKFSCKSIRFRKCTTQTQSVSTDLNLHQYQSFFSFLSTHAQPWLGAGGMATAKFTVVTSSSSNCRDKRPYISTLHLLVCPVCVCALG